MNLNRPRLLVQGLLRSRSRLLTILFFVALAAIVVGARWFGLPFGTLSQPSPAAATARPRAYFPFTPNAPIERPGAAPGSTAGLAPAPPAASETASVPTVPPNVGAVPTITPELGATATPTAASSGASNTPGAGPYKAYFPYFPGGGVPPPPAPPVVAATATPQAETPQVATPPVATPQVATPQVTIGTPTPTSAPATPPPPTPTRPPIRITKLGLGVYDSGGALLPDLDLARPSVILLQDPNADFAREVRQHFPKAFIVGRVFAANEPVDNPTQRGHDFADRVAAVAVPLKGVVDAWISYNEVGSSGDPAALASYCAFQTAFAQHLQNDYGIAAVAGNDGPRAVTAQDYVRYCADAIRTSKYFGFHDYTNPDITSLRDPRAADQVFYYRTIHNALVAAGIASGPFIATETGLYNGWRGVTSDTSMAQDYVWLADQMTQDPYVLGECVYGLFLPGRWTNFNVDASDILQMMGDYNTVH